MSRAVAALLAIAAACGSGDAPKPVTVHTAAAPPRAVPPRPADPTEVEARVRAATTGQDFSGYVLVAQHDRPVYAQAFGYADRAAKAVATADTSFRIGSVTKPFTAAAIFVLAQDGELSLDDPIGVHLPAYPAVGRGVTIRQLLTHTGGVPSYTRNPIVMLTRDRPRTVAELVATFSGLPLDSPPGTRFEYSNSGYVVLGAIIEAASGMSYGDFVRTRLFAPAGMTRTEYGDAEGIRDRALGYMAKSSGSVEPAPAIHMSVPFSAGGLRSTANDLVRWHRALAGDAILTAASKQTMYTPPTKDAPYAYGWIVAPVDGHRVIAHNGGIDGFRTEYVRIPDLDVVIVVWSNVPDRADVEDVRRAAVKAVLGPPV